MTRLEKIFEIGDEQERISQLLGYARKLKLSVQDAKKPNGEYSENELAVLIYAAEEKQKTAKFQNLGCFFVGLFLMFIFMIAIFLFISMISAG